MGGPRQRPDRLGEKLAAFRKQRGYSLAEMANFLSDDKASVTRFDIHDFEKNTRDPSLIILLRYARMANVTIDVFADDEQDLPE